MLNKLTIIPFANPRYEQGGPPVGLYIAMFNPESYSVSHNFEYDSKQPPGATGSNNRFKNIRPPVYNFEFLVDGTGASGSKREVFADIELFKYTVGFFGGIHRTHYLVLVWGTFIVKAVLTNMQVKYEMFRPNGTPLRATITASFQAQSETLLEQLINNITSPDLTHLRTVNEGETLPLMAHEVYKDPRHYFEVARANDLNSFRKIDSGEQLQFPPIDKKTR